MCPLLGSAFTSIMEPTNMPADGLFYLNELLFNIVNLLTSAHMKGEKQINAKRPYENQMVNHRTSWDEFEKPNHVTTPAAEMTADHLFAYLFNLLKIT